MTKDILFGFLSHASSALRRSCYACWGHPKPRQNVYSIAVWTNCIKCANMNFHLLIQEIIVILRLLCLPQNTVYNTISPSALPHQKRTAYLQSLFQCVPATYPVFYFKLLPCPADHAVTEMRNALILLGLLMYRSARSSSLNQPASFITCFNLVVISSDIN